MTRLIVFIRLRLKKLPFLAVEIIPSVWYKTFFVAKSYFFCYLERNAKIQNRRQISSGRKVSGRKEKERKKKNNDKFSGS